MSEKYPHLTQEAAEVAGRSVEDRLAYLNVFKWMPYERADEVLEIFENLLVFPARLRMPCVLLYGPSDNGKSTLIEKLERTHPFDPNPDGDADIRPIVKIDVSDIEIARDLLESILNALNAPFTKKESKPTWLKQIKTLFARLGVRLLVIDEVHDIGETTRSKQMGILRQIKCLSNVLRIPIVAVGTELAIEAFRINLQVFNRFQPVSLPRWEDGKEFRKLLANFEATLPLKLPSHLAQNDTIASDILEKTDGILGDISKFLVKATQEAIKPGEDMSPEEFLSEDRLVALKYTAADRARQELYTDEYRKRTLARTPEAQG